MRVDREGWTGQDRALEAKEHSIVRFTPIATVRDMSVARVLLVALRAHGFNPLEPREGGLPGVPNIFGPGGVSVEVPEDEAQDAELLAADLLKDMGHSTP